MMPNETRSLPDLFSTLVSELSTLFRQEIRLARAEAIEKTGQALGAAAMIGIGAVLMIPALVLLLEAIAAFVVRAGLPPEWATLVVSIVIIILALLLVGIGVSRLKASSLTPDRTIEQVQRDAAVAKDQIR